MSISGISSRISGYLHERVRQDSFPSDAENSRFGQLYKTGLKERADHIAHGTISSDLETASFEELGVLVRRKIRETEKEGDATSHLPSKEPEGSVDKNSHTENIVPSQHVDLSRELPSMHDDVALKRQVTVSSGSIRSKIGQQSSALPFSVIGLLPVSTSVRSVSASSFETAPAPDKPVAMRTGRDGQNIGRLSNIDIDIIRGKTGLVVTVSLSKLDERERKTLEIRLRRIITEMGEVVEDLKFVFRPDPSNQSPFVSRKETIHGTD